MNEEEYGEGLKERINSFLMVNAPGEATIDEINDIAERMYLSLASIAERIERDKHIMLDERDQ